MTALMLPGILSGHSAPVPGAVLLLTVMPRLRITVYFFVFFLFFLLILFLSPKAVAAETTYSNISGRNYLLSGIKLRNFYRMIYMSNTEDRKVLLQQTPDELILQYAENRLALFNSAMDKDPSGLLCFSFIYPAELSNGTAITFLPAKKQCRVYLRQKLTHYIPASFSGCAIPMVICWMKRKAKLWKRMPYWPVK